MDCCAKLTAARVFIAQFDQLQVYLDEFVFRHNRRQIPMAAFQTLLGLGTARRPVLYTQIKGASDLSRALRKD
jgi:hypothetical protein